MNDLINTCFGQGQDLDALQMSCRAFCMFFITLALIRISGMRAFGQKSAFDSIIVILLGSVLSRAVVGVSPFIPTVSAGFVFASVHRLLAVVTVYSDRIGAIIKGKKTTLYKNDTLIEKNMFLCSISFKDMMEELRLNLHQDNLNNVKEIIMERSGKISIIKKESN